MLFPPASENSCKSHFSMISFVHSSTNHCMIRNATTIFHVSNFSLRKNQAEEKALLELSRLRLVQNSLPQDSLARTSRMLRDGAPVAIYAMRMEDAAAETRLRSCFGL